MENSKANTGVGGLCTIVFIMFLILKLAGVSSVATWSWVWITSPLWLPVAIVLGFLLAMSISAIIAFVFVQLLNLIRKKK